MRPVSSEVLDAAFARWAARTLDALLRIIQLERDGRPFEPDALRLRTTRVPQSPIANPQSAIGLISPALAAREEPEIHLAWLALRTILEHFELLADGKAVVPTGFALRRLEDWTFTDVPNAAMIGALSMPCPYSCEFCYEDGLPDRAAPLRGPRAANAELDARMALWRRGLDVAGLRGLRYGEVLPHPRFAETLALIRELTDQPIVVATAGAGLDEARIRALAGRPRVLLQFSLNTCDPERRRRLMGDRNAERLLRALPLLRELDVAFIASAVAWPGLPFEDLEASVRAAETHGALHFVVFLPSFSRHFAEREPFDWRAQWAATAEFVRRLRPKVAIPVRLAPDAWEAAEFFGDPLALEVIGATSGSPAAAAGLRPGDRVLEVRPCGADLQVCAERRADLEVCTTRAAARDVVPPSRPALNRLLEEAWRGRRTLEVVVERGGERLAAVLSPSAKGRYDTPPTPPYTKGGRTTAAASRKQLEARAAAPHYAEELDAPYGLHVYGGPDERELERIRDLLRGAGARRAWVLSSQLLAAPYGRLWERAAPGLSAGDPEVEFLPVANLFWGGNIVVGDLLTAGDFARAARARLDSGARPPDVLLVPFSPFHPVWWKDLRGGSFFEIERRTGLTTLPIFPTEGT